MLPCVKCLLSWWGRRGIWWGGWWKLKCAVQWWGERIYRKYQCSQFHSTDEVEIKEEGWYDMTTPTRLLTVLSSPPCGTLASTETIANASILAFTAHPAVWSIRVIRAGWKQKAENSTAKCDTHKGENMLLNLYAYYFSKKTNVSNVLLTLLTGAPKPAAGTGAAVRVW